MNENTLVALMRLRQLMDMEFLDEQDHQKKIDIAKVVLQSSKAQLETHTKVDENYLRAKELDIMPQLMKEIDEYEKSKIIDGEVV